MKATLIRFCGNDLDVVNNARVSFDNESEWHYGCQHCDRKMTLNQKEPIFCEENGCVFKQQLSAEDESLIKFLARGCSSKDWKNNSDTLYSGDIDRELWDKLLSYVQRMPTHWAPFANGISVTFRIKAPIPIMRQVFKHKVGAVESEVSRRYVTDEPEFFEPEWRKAAENVKQGSSDETFLPESFKWGFTAWDHLGRPADLVMDAEDFFRLAGQFYNHLLEQGVCPEQARFVLPQATYTEAIVTNSLYGWSRFYNQRSDRQHAQREIADLADQIGAECARLFPVSWPALTA